MTSYTFSGYKAITTGAQGRPPESFAFATAEMTMVFEDGWNGVTYSHPFGADSGELPETRFATTDNAVVNRLYATTIDGQSWAGRNFDAMGFNDVEFGEIEIDGARTQILRLQFDDDVVDTGTEYFFALGGAPLAAFDAVLASPDPRAAFDALEQALDYVGPVRAGGPQPGAPIDLAQAPGVTVSEDDWLRIYSLETFGDYRLGAGDDYLIADDLNDAVYGGAGNDTLLTGAGTDFAEAGPGDDVIVSGGDGSNFYAGDGDDTLVGTGWFDLFQGGDGADLFVPFGHVNNLTEGAFDEVDLAINAFGAEKQPDAHVDTVVGTVEHLNAIYLIGHGSGDRLVVLEALKGGAGAAVSYDLEMRTIDVDIGGDGSVEAKIAFAGYDFATPPPALSTQVLGDDLVIHFGTPAPIDTASYDISHLPVNRTAQAGDETMLGGDAGDTLRGGDGADLISGSAGDDLLEGYAGDDTLAGSHDNDTVSGGAGHDNMGGGLGDDRLDGGPGNDTLGAGQGDDGASGGDGDDGVFGGAGNDTLDGGAGNDTMGGGFGHDQVQGGDGDDSLGGGTGRDTIGGGEGADAIGAGEGNDTVNGDAGDDTVNGGGRHDLLFGDAGDDQINGGAGNDTMSGGAGADLFVFNGFEEGAVDIIIDWTDGEDMFRMKGVANAPGTGLAGKVAALGPTQVGADVELSHGGQVIVVQGATVDQIGVEDFVFL